jgi:hypothetical protein
MFDGPGAGLICRVGVLSGHRPADDIGEKRYAQQHGAAEQYAPRLLAGEWLGFEPGGGQVAAEEVQRVELLVRRRVLIYEQRIRALVGLNRDLAHQDNRDCDRAEPPRGSRRRR